MRRVYVLHVFAWPSAEAQSRLENLPVVGPNLFNNQFLNKLVEEVKRHERMAATSFNLAAAVAEPSPSLLLACQSCNLAIGKERVWIVDLL